MTEFVGEAQSVLKESRPDAGLGIYVVPDVNGLAEPLTGQRIGDLAPLVDWVAPMLYHNILLQPPSWIAPALADVVERGRTEGAARAFRPIPIATPPRPPIGALRWRTPTGTPR